MGASATLVLIGLLCFHCLELVSSNRVLKESTHTKDGSSSAWVTVAGSVRSSASAIGYGSGSGSGTAIRTRTGSGSVESVGVGIGVGGDSGLGSGLGTGTGIGVETSIGTATSSGTGLGIGIGGEGATGSGTGAVCDRPICDPVRKVPTCNHGTRCNLTEEPPIEVPIWVLGECADQGVVFEPPVSISSGCQEVGCNHGRICGSSRTRETPVTKIH